MIRGLYTSAIGMTTQMKKMDVVTNNIANADTNGFKKDNVITQTFTEELMRRLNDPNKPMSIVAPEIGKMALGLAVDDVYTDFSTGAFKQTTGELDVAIDGSGFFAVSTVDANGNAIERYTRDGSFSLTENNTLVTNDGKVVLGENGVIQIPNGNITINDDGSVYSGETLVDRIRMVDFENKESLRKFGDNLYDRTPQSTEIPFSGKLVQGYLEGSNVNAVREMVDMITLSRNYETNQRAISTMDDTLARAVNDLGKK